MAIRRSEPPPLRIGIHARFVLHVEPVFGLISKAGVLVHPFIQRLNARDPVVVDFIGQPVEDVLPVFHATGDDRVDAFVLSTVADQVLHVNTTALLADPLQPAETLL